MAEWNENKLEQELENLMEDIPVQEDLEKKIQQSITRRIKRTAGITVISILLAAAVLFLCISPLMDMMFWNPATSVEGDQSLVFSVLRDYWEVNAPYVDLVSLQVEKQGFGCYELAIQVTDHQGSLQIGQANLWMELNRGKYENRRDADGYFVHRMGGRFEANVDAERKAEAMQSLLPGAHFFRANRQFIVARRSIREISVWFGSRLSLHLTVETPERIVISKARVPEFKAWLRTESRNE